LGNSTSRGSYIIDHIALDERDGAISAVEDAAAAIEGTPGVVAEDTAALEIQCLSIGDTGSTEGSNVVRNEEVCRR